MTTHAAEPLAMRITLWARDDDMIALGVLAPDDLNTREWREGDTLTLTVIGVERSRWSGVAVQ